MYVLGLATIPLQAPEVSGLELRLGAILGDTIMVTNDSMTSSPVLGELRGFPEEGVMLQHRS